MPYLRFPQKERPWAMDLRICTDWWGGRLTQGRRRQPKLGSQVPEPETETPWEMAQHTHFRTIRARLQESHNILIGSCICMNMCWKRCGKYFPICSRKQIFLEEGKITKALIKAYSWTHRRSLWKGTQRTCSPPSQKPDNQQLYLRIEGNFPRERRTRNSMYQKLCSWKVMSSHSCLSQHYRQASDKLINARKSPRHSSDNKNCFSWGHKF